MSQHTSTSSFKNYATYMLFARNHIYIYIYICKIWNHIYICKIWSLIGQICCEKKKIISDIKLRKFQVENILGQLQGRSLNHNFKLIIPTRKMIRYTFHLNFLLFRFIRWTLFVKGSIDEASVMERCEMWITPSLPLLPQC